MDETTPESVRKIGKYTILRPLGAGGMASVFLGHDPDLDRDVAIKVLPNLDADWRARFQREARLIANVTHEAVVPVYDYGEHQGTPYIVMAVMRGGSLEDKIKENGGTLALSDALPALKRVASALDAAHAQGVVHRDVKPANILFDEAGAGYLADFGIARSSNAGGTLTVPGGVVGTPAYMSPEQWTADWEPAPSADVYALGRTTLRCLQGAIADDPTEPVVGLPAATGPIVARCLAREPADRWPTATAFVTALEAATLAERSNKRSSWRPVAIAAAAMVVVTGGIGGAFAAGAFDGDSPDPGRGSESNSPAAGTSGLPVNQGARAIMIVDSSKSMGESFEGVPKKEIVQQLLTTTLGTLPADTNMTVWAMGSRPFVSDDQSCDDVLRIAGPASLSTLAVASTLAALQPNGKTPVSVAISRAVDDAAKNGVTVVRVFVVVDGRDDCGETPQAAVAAAQRKKINVELHVVGIHLDSDARDQYLLAIRTAGKDSNLLEVTDPGKPPVKTSSSR
jgi:hypothetical protein